MRKDNKLRYQIPLLLLIVVVFLSLLDYKMPSLNTQNSTINYADTAWLLIASGLVFLMTPGLGLFYGGMVRYKNLVSTLLQSFITLGIVSVLWVVVGFSFAFGDSVGGIIGNPATFFMFRNVGLVPNTMFASTIPFMLFAMFQLKFAIITPAIITGGIAERVRFSSLILFICLFSLLIYSPIAHWTWHPDGFIHKWGVLDFAGGTVVHISAATAAFVGAFFLGNRKSITTHQPTNIPYILLGAGLLWFGWFGFNGGSSLAANEVAVKAFFNTNIASAMAMITWVFLDSFFKRKRSAVGAAIGAVIGLVAITPAAGYISAQHSIIFGFMASIICYFAIIYKNKTNIDDTLDVFPCHGIGGIVGMILTAIFAENVGVIHGHWNILWLHLLTLVIVLVYVSIGSYLLFRLTNLILPMRVTYIQENKGLDITQHGEEATDWKTRQKEIVN